MNAAYRDEDVYLVLDDGSAHLIDRPQTLAEQIRMAATDAARVRHLRIMSEQRAARVAAWLADHPGAIEINNGRWWDAASMSVLDRDNDRLTSRDLRAGAVPAMRVRVPSGRVGHIWTGGPQTACRRWLGSDTEATDAPLCAACARIQEAK